MTKKVHKIRTMSNIEAGECRWPIGDPRQDGFHFCGAQQVLGKPYCQAHCSQSVEPAKPRGAASARPVPMIKAA
jgi:GcrA cell cycle regulator